MISSPGGGNSPWRGVAVPWDMRKRHSKIEFIPAAGSSPCSSLVLTAPLRTRNNSHRADYCFKSKPSFVLVLAHLRLGPWPTGGRCASYLAHVLAAWCVCSSRAVAETFRKPQICTDVRIPALRCGQTTALEVPHSDRITPCCPQCQCLRWHKSFHLPQLLQSDVEAWSSVAPTVGLTTRDNASRFWHAPGPP